MRALKKLTLTGATPRYDAPAVYLAGPDDPATLDGQAFAFTVLAADLAPNTADPEADR